MTDCVLLLLEGWFCSMMWKRGKQDRPKLPFSLNYYLGMI